MENNKRVIELPNSFLTAFSEFAYFSLCIRLMFMKDYDEIQKAQDYAEYGLECLKFASPRPLNLVTS